MGILNILEVSKKQYFIFKSNKLKENIGASEIIRLVTEELALNLCQKYYGKLVNAGGGQTIFYFDSMDNSKTFSRELSLELLKSYPSLEFFISSIDYDPDKDPIIRKIDELHRKLENKKAKREQYSYIIDFGITQECDSTRLPAVWSQYDSDEYRTVYYSAEVKSKIDMFNKFKEKENKNFVFDFADLGISKNEKSYVAITHIDGNRMGQKLKKLRDRFENRYAIGNTRQINEEFTEQLQRFSKEIDSAYKSAFDKLTDTLQGKLDYLKAKGLNIKDNILPIRKVVLSGDDVCYITDARIALECAAIFLTELEKHEVLNEKLTACAGIAMVREKYPFFKTYQLSEELCRNAKSGIPDDANESRMDWHIVQGEYNNNLKEIRDKEYVANDGKYLLLRPLVVSEDVRAYNSYRNFKEDMKIIMSDKVPRSKIKNMIKEMKKGEDHLDMYIEINRLYPLLGTHRNKAKTGFADGRCVLFDAVEAMDYYIPLNDWEE